MMLGVDGTLHIVPDHPAAPATCRHRASIGISQGYLLVLGLHHQGVQTVQAQYLLTQGRNLLVEPGDLGLRYRFPLAISTVELREIPRNALVNLRQPPLHLGLREVPVSRVDGLELAAVDRNARLAEQFKASAQHHELAANPADGFAIVLAEVGYGLEVRHQAAGQPNQLDVALALPFQAPARLHPIEVIRRRKSSTASPDDRPAFLSSPARRRQSPARPGQAHRQTHRSPGPDCPRPNSHLTTRETTCSGCGHRQRQSAPSNPPVKLPKNHIIGGRFHTVWTRNGHQAMWSACTSTLPPRSCLT